MIEALIKGGAEGLVSGVGTLAVKLREAFTGDSVVSSEERIKILELSNALETASQQIDLAVINGQNAINLEEAKSEKLWISGWRPYIGWVGGSAFAYSVIIEPLLSWCARVSGYAGEFPKIDTSLTGQILIAMLGIGVMRSYDKWQSPNPKGKE